LVLSAAAQKQRLAGSLKAQRLPAQALAVLRAPVIVVPPQ
jgi:hypothetical protein